MSAPVDVLAVSIFGDLRTARITKGSRNWKVAWQGMNVDSFVPLSMAICSREAAIKAAAVIENRPWDCFLSARISEIRNSDGAISTEMARWVAAKIDNVPFDRHGKESAAKVHHRACAALEGAGA